LKRLGLKGSGALPESLRFGLLAKEDFEEQVAVGTKSSHEYEERSQAIGNSDLVQILLVHVEDGVCGPGTCDKA